MGTHWIHFRFSSNAKGIERVSEHPDQLFQRACVPALTSPMRAVVAIPARDEEALIAPCLKALLKQRDRYGSPPAGFTFGIVLLLNNCADRSAEVARACLADGGVPFMICEVQLPPGRANAGSARRLAMDIAALWMERSGDPDGLILTTDADSRVPDHWVERNLAALRHGACAVAGRLHWDRPPEAGLPPSLLHRVKLEEAYEARLAQLASRLDPLAHDPWPNHRTASGASYAVTLDAYRAIGGLPDIPCGEDRALARALERQDILIRHSPDVSVLTSTRLKGRAQGGAADTLKARCDDPDLPGDPALEPLAAAARRYAWRRHLRVLHRQGRLAHEAFWRRGLRLPAEAQEWPDAPHFGSFWAKVEEASPLLERRAVRPSEMPAQIAAADILLLGADYFASRQSSR